MQKIDFILGLKLSSRKALNGKAFMYACSHNPVILSQMFDRVNRAYAHRGTTIG